MEQGPGGEAMKAVGLVRDGGKEVRVCVSVCVQDVFVFCPIYS